MTGLHSTARQMTGRLRRIANSPNPEAYTVDVVGMRNHLTHVFRRAMGSLNETERQTIREVVAAAETDIAS